MFLNLKSMLGYIIDNWAWVVCPSLQRGVGVARHLNSGCSLNLTFFSGSSVLPELLKNIWKWIKKFWAHNHYRFGAKKKSWSSQIKIKLNKKTYYVTWIIRPRKIYIFFQQKFRALFKITSLNYHEGTLDRSDAEISYRDFQTRFLFSGWENFSSCCLWRKSNTCIIVPQAPQKNNFPKPTKAQ